MLAAMLECRGKVSGVDSFIYGMLCHLALDAAEHPYIESQYQGYDHTRFEVNIDMQLYKEHKAETGVPGQRQRGADVERINAFVAALVERLYSKRIGNAYKRSYRKLLRVHRWTFDPSGRKLKLTRWLDRLIKKPNCISGFIMAETLPDLEDCRNLQGREWAAPWKPGVIRNESFDHLFENGVADAVRWISLLREGRVDELKKLLGNISMDKGEVG